MGKQKQQVISRFFSPETKAPSTPSPSSPLPSFRSSSPRSPKIAATVPFSPSKRRLTSELASQQHTKAPKLSPSNPVPTPINPTIHQKFIKKLFEPQVVEQSFKLEDSSSIHPSISQSNGKYTPLEQQVVDLKRKYPDVLLMVEVGYKFRFFGEDAEISARVLGIYAHLDHNFLTASVPIFRLNVHVRRLVNAGYKVGVVKQTETAAIKAHGSNKLGPFCRGLSALYTKATLEAAEELGGGEEGCGGESNYLTCIVEEEVVAKNTDCVLESGFDVRVGIIAVEISTGEVAHGEFNDYFMRSGLESVILSLSPVELLMGMPLSALTEKTLLAYAGSSSHVRVERASRDSFKDGGALAEVASLCETSKYNSGKSHQDNLECTQQENQLATIEGIMAMPALSVQALALAIQHLKQFGLERIISLGASLRPISSSLEMTLSGNALQQLQVLNSNSDGSKSSVSLFQTMNHTFTVFGSRLLKQWVTHPLCDRSTISSRLDAVTEIVEAMGYSKSSQNLSMTEIDRNGISVQAEIHLVLSSVLASLGRSPDIQRGITRIFHRTATASEFIAVIQAFLFAGRNLQQLLIEDVNVINPRCSSITSALLRKLISAASSPSLIKNAAELLSSLNKDAADKGDLPNMFINPERRFPEVASAQSAVQLSKGKLDLLIVTYREQLGMRNLEFSSVSGTTHLLEVLQRMFHYILHAAL